MITVRWVMNTQRGASWEAAQILKRARGQKGTYIPSDARIGVSDFGTSDQVQVEFDHKDLSAHDQLLREIGARPPTWFQEINPLLMNNDTLESWTIVE
jgi:hypothetical protein